MIIDLTQSEFSQQMGLRAYFSDSINLIRVLILAKSILPEWYYEEIKKEVISLASNS